MIGVVSLTVGGALPLVKVVVIELVVVVVSVGRAGRDRAWRDGQQRGARHVGHLWAELLLDEVLLPAEFRLPHLEDGEGVAHHAEGAELQQLHSDLRDDAAQRLVHWDARARVLVVAAEVVVEQVLAVAVRDELAARVRPAGRLIHDRVFPQLVRLLVQGLERHQREQLDRQLGRVDLVEDADRPVLILLAHLLQLLFARRGVHLAAKARRHHGRTHRLR
mmetsp:Transcript_46994/g.138674  ORF Transcript_46994/g.138674 Transcript_46994/m.138674 type:complete len:220 (+) Transcript_46994:1075-1734(+)